jgi:hypothetical protein
LAALLAHTVQQSLTKNTTDVAEHISIHAPSTDLQKNKALRKIHAWMFICKHFGKELNTATG